MRQKPKYNRGDILQYQLICGDTELCVITGVFEDKYGIMVIADGWKTLSSINNIDNNDHIRLYARGQ